MLTRTLAAFCLFAGAAFADNVMHPSTPVLDRPTLMSLGVQLPFTGDDNHNGSVTVRYRPASATTWQSALKLYRVQPATVFAFTVTTQFAGSIFDLKPATTYTIELNAVDPDGAVNQTFTLTATTRPIPADPPSPRAVAVANAAQFRAALVAATAGDIITLAPGTYLGQFGMSRSGTAGNPIVIRGASQSAVVIDGQGCTGCNILEVYGSNVHVENLTLRNAERAIRFQTAAAQNNVVRGVHIQNTRLGIGGRGNQLDFYIADNILEGRLAWPKIYTDDGGAHSDDDGIAVSGFGMVVAHNRISGYGDAIKTTQHGARALDVYGNDVLWTYDNGLELDEAEGNARALRNRFTNCSTPLSVQPVYAGPAYILRNVVTNTVDEQVKFHALNIASPPPQPNGVFVLNNTFVSARNALQVQTPFGSYHAVLENNLFLGPAPPPGNVVNWDSPLHDALFDYNGYYPDGRFLFRWDTGTGNYPNFAALKAAGVEPHGLLLSSQTFASGLQPPTNYRNLMAPPDATLSPAGGAVDRGLVLPNISDGFTGTAPDLGALEVGCPMPVYGPRPAGVDERNEPLGCGVTTGPPPPPPSSGTATFLSKDLTTSGNWRSAYGAEGSVIVGDAPSPLPFATVTPSGQITYVWAGSTNDVRAPWKRASTTDRVAGCWHSASVFNIALNLTDGLPHQVALYALDWDNLGGGRAQQVEILDSNGAVLDTQNLSNYQTGQYLVWMLSGTLTIRITNTNGPAHAVVTGLFFGGPVAAAPSATAAFLGKDTTTQGNWKSAYGSEGAIVIGDTAVLPTYATVTPVGHTTGVWNPSTADLRALLKRASPTDRVAGFWSSPSSFSVALNFTDNRTHRVALYAGDWDNYGNGRTQTIEVLDAAGNVLDTRALTGFQAGQYFIWNLSGSLTLRVTNTNAKANGVISGIFFQ